MEDQEFNHTISDEVSKGVEAGLKKAQAVARNVFGDSYRTRDTYVVYELLMAALHCEHGAEEKKEPWET